MNKAALQWDLVVLAPSAVLGPVLLDVTPSSSHTYSVNSVLTAQPDQRNKLACVHGSLRQVPYLILSFSTDIAMSTSAISPMQPYLRSPRPRQEASGS